MPTATLHIHPRLLETAATVRYEFDLVYSGSSRVETVFYELDRDTAPPRVDNFDGILCAIVLHAMQERRDIRLHGPATSLIVRNLSEFQLAWSCWRPNVYQPVEIDADTFITPRVRALRSMSAFSGGLDSTFTLLRNNPRSDTPRYGVERLVLVHGFDVSLGNPEALQELVDRTEPLRELTQTPQCIVRTNSRELRLQKWEDSCGAELAACLHLFSSEFTHALIGSSDAYDELWLPWGTSPVTDHLLSGGELTIVHDGAAFCRTDKVAFLSEHPIALRTLKVCTDPKHQGRNCSVCEKCVRTQLNLLAAGITSAPCFDRFVDLRGIRHLPIRSDLALAELRSIVKYGEQHRIDEEWFRVLRQRFNRGKDRKRRTFRERVRRSLAKTRLLDTARRVRSKLAMLTAG
jgi:hypothetical protein